MPKTDAVSPTLIGFVAYLVAVLLAGLATFRLNKTQEDFLLAGRRLNIWVATFSERASGESAWLLVGFPAAAMTVGLVEGWTAIGCVLGIGAAWFTIAEPLRRESARLNALTLPEFFTARFGVKTNAIRLVATGIIVFFYAFYVAAQFNGAGKVLFTTFGIPPFWGITLGAGVIILYTLMGGFFAVAWTDFLQALIMLGTLVILPIVGYLELVEQGGSLGASLEAAPHIASWTGQKTGLLAVAAVLGGLSWGLGYFGQPHTVIRFMSIDKPETIRRGRLIAVAWAAPAFAGSTLIGLIGLGLYAEGVLADPEHVMPRMATDLLPAWVAGIFISGAIAAMMSTADSQLLVGTSAVAEDLLHRARGKSLSPGSLVTLSRAVTLVLGLAGYTVALSNNTTVFGLVDYAWSGLGASFGPALILTLHWSGTRARGVLLGMVTGSLTSVVWSSIDLLEQTVSARLVAFTFALLAVVLGSLSAARSDEQRALGA